MIKVKVKVKVKIKVIAIIKVKVKVKVKIRVILQRLKDFVRVYISKVIKGRYRYLSNSNLNFLTIFFLTRKLYTGLDITGDTAI